MVPLSWVSKPAMSRSNVVFPQPLGPSSVKNSFERMASETPSSARTAPAPKVLEMFRQSTATVSVWTRTVGVASGRATASLVTLELAEPVPGALIDRACP